MWVFGFLLTGCCCCWSDRSTVVSGCREEQPVCCWCCSCIYMQVLRQWEEPGVNTMHPEPQTRCKMDIFVQHLYDSCSAMQTHSQTPPMGGAFNNVIMIIWTVDITIFDCLNSFIYIRWRPTCLSELLNVKQKSFFFFFWSEDFFFFFLCDFHISIPRGETFRWWCCSL